MTIDGIWKLEISSLHGWERLSTVFLENGRYLSASADHYSVGKYEVDGKKFTAETSATQHGNIRTIFGSKQEKLDTVLKGKIKKDVLFDLPETNIAIGINNFLQGSLF